MPRRRTYISLSNKINHLFPTEDLASFQAPSRRRNTCSAPSVGGRPRSLPSFRQHQRPIPLIPPELPPAAKKPATLAYIKRSGVVNRVVNT